ncbi:MAG: four helix bundle protein [Lishizhenia sp.]
MGANLGESQRAVSTKDFTHKLSISLKEADETKYWLEIIDRKIKKVDASLKEDNEELIEILVSIIKKSKLK